MAEIPWTSRCCESNCIQTRLVGDQVEIRDTERPEATLLVPAKAWEEFLASVRAVAPVRYEVLKVAEVRNNEGESR